MRSESIIEEVKRENQLLQEATNKLQVRPHHTDNSGLSGLSVA